VQGIMISAGAAGDGSRDISRLGLLLKAAAPSWQSDQVVRRGHGHVHWHVHQGVYEYMRRTWLT
jgi:hypothetical protein